VYVYVCVCVCVCVHTGAMCRVEQCGQLALRPLDDAHRLPPLSRLLLPQRRLEGLC
jgi:hypothetical protein